MGFFKNRNKNIPQPIQERPNQPKRENDNCEIKVKRDGNGRIIGMTSKGKCTKEDRAIFARENGVSPESLEEKNES